MKLITAEEARHAEREWMQSTGLPALVLIENAARAVAQKAACMCPSGRMAVVCGGGTNGADGLAAARMLAAAGRQVAVFSIGTAREDGDAAVCMKALKAFGVAPRMVGESDMDALLASLREADLVIDALLGTGLAGAVKALQASAIHAMNACGRPILAVDMPSGVCADTGGARGAAVKAAAVVTFGAVKRGLMLHPGAYLAGEVVLADIGLPPYAFAAVATETLCAGDVRQLLPYRAPRAHKYSVGSVLSVAGCDRMTGAAVLAASAAYRAGAGLVTAAGTERVVSVLQGRLPEALTLALPSEAGAPRVSGALTAAKARASAVLLGPGLSDCAASESFVLQFIEGVQAPVVLDADALNILARHKAALHALTAETPVVLTPHMAEMSRLTGIPAEALLDDTIGAATGLARETNAVVALKDACTVIAAPDGRVTVNATGCNALAKAGAGDVLAGTIAALLAQGLCAYDAARVGCYIHGLAGQRAAAAKSIYGVNASDIVDWLPETMQYIIEVQLAKDVKL